MIDFKCRPIRSSYFFGFGERRKWTQLWRSWGGQCPLELARTWTAPEWDCILTGGDDGSSLGLGSDRFTLVRKTVPRMTLTPVASRSFQRLLDICSPHLNTDLQAVLSTLRLNNVQCGVVRRADPLVTTLEVNLNNRTSDTGDDDRTRSGDVVDWFWFTWKHRQTVLDCLWPWPWPWPCCCHWQQTYLCRWSM